MGCFCNATPNGDFFSVVYPFGGFGLSAESGLQPGQFLQEGMCSWQTGTNHVHGQSENVMG